MGVPGGGGTPIEKDRKTPFLRLEDTGWIDMSQSTWEFPIVKTRSSHGSNLKFYHTLIRVPPPLVIMNSYVHQGLFRDCLVCYITDRRHL